MNDQSVDAEIVSRSFRRDECMELRLALEAAGIANEVLNQSGEWLLCVASIDEAAALRELAAYRADNPLTKPTPRPPVPVLAGATIGAFLYAAILVAIGSISGSEESRPLWYAIGEMNAGEVMNGQIWRTVTALTLHANAEHLCSNLAFGCVFGWMVGRILGGGVAWLTILMAGAIGNEMNAAMREPTFSSIGASTAVFAALGIMVAHALHPRYATDERLLKRWSPLIAGVLLLALIGVGGERTDVGAHTLGFIAGIVLGWLAARLPQRWLVDERVQMMAGIIAMAMLSAAWVAAIQFAVQ